MRWAGAADQMLDTGPGEGRHAGHGRRHASFDAIQVAGQVLLTEIRGDAVHVPEHGLLLVDANQHAVALLAQVV